MASTVSYKIGVYNKTAVGQNSASLDPQNSTVDEFLKHPTNVKWSIPLNGVDQLTFDLLLNDPAAALISTKTTFIRLWRYVTDTVNSKTLTPSTGTPDFCGIVTATNKVASENKMSVTCMSPLWRLQTHFHIDNHRLVTDAASLINPPTNEGGNGDGLPWDQSALMFYLIDLINGAFHASGGDTGIRKPTTRAYNSGTTFWPKTINVSPFFVQKGSYTWPLIFEDLMARASAPDIVPQYIYTSGSANLMYFKTLAVRGTNKTSTMSFDYRTGNKNLDDMTESSAVVPGAYGNFQWVVGDGGPNGGILDEESNTTDIGNYGIYMVRKDVRGTKLSDVEALGPLELAVSRQNDAKVYTIQVAPGGSKYFGIDYGVGDLVKLNADKGALSVSNKSQRIYQADLSWSDNNVETVELSISNDFKTKFPGG
jgi:hypothetical protein